MTNGAASGAEERRKIEVVESNRIPFLDILFGFGPTVPFIIGAAAARGASVLFAPETPSDANRSTGVGRFDRDRYLEMEMSWKLDSPSLGRRWPRPSPSGHRRS